MMSHYVWPRSSRRWGVAICMFAMLLAAVGAPPYALRATEGRQQPPVSTATGEWPTYGGDLANSKYSPLDQITAANFGSLRIAWRATTPDAFLSLTLPDGTEWSADS